MSKSVGKTGRKRIAEELTEAAAIAALIEERDRLRSALAHTFEYLHTLDGKLPLEDLGALRTQRIHIRAALADNT